MSVCPHDTAKNVYGWFMLNTYVQRHLAARIRFEPQDNFLKEREHVLASEHHIVYANPYSAVMFAQQGFVPVAKPVGIYDETFLVSLADAPDISTLSARPKVASATDKLIIHNLGLTLLPQVGLDAEAVDFVMAGNHLAAAKAVMDGKADLGFVFNETWHGMSKLIRAQLKVIAETHQGFAFHCFMVGPEWADRAQEIQELLCGMTEDKAGVAILEDLRFTQGFEPVPEGNLQRLAEMMGL